MPELRIEASWRGPSAAWRQPAHQHRQYAALPTDRGEYALFRGPGERLTPSAKAGARERWRFTLGEDVVLEIDDAAAPWYGLRARMRAGIKGRVDGVPFTARAASRSFAQRRRGIHFALDDGRNLSFTPHRFHQHLNRSAGGDAHVISRSKGGRWNTDHLNRGELALLCFVVISGADALLTSPLADL